MTIIHCIGDSQVCFFSGANTIHPLYPNYIGNNPPFQTYRLGPCLAYNLCSLNTKTRGREKLFDLIEVLPEESDILLVFGEIDCRAHLGKQADLQKRTVEDVVKECVNRYFQVALELRNLKFNVGFFGAIPSTHRSGLNPKFPTYGTCQERNFITRLFNDYLEVLCRKNQLVFISIFKDILNSDLTPKMEFYMDGNHLSQKAFLPFAWPKIKSAYAIQESEAKEKEAELAELAARKKAELAELAARKKAELAELAAREEAELAELAEEPSKYIIAAPIKKSFHESDFSSGRYIDTVSIAFVFENKFTKNIEAFKGTAIFKDLSGKEIRKLNVAYSDGLRAGEKINWYREVAYNDDILNLRKFKNIEIDNMKFEWKTLAIIFEDGSKLGKV